MKTLKEQQKVTRKKIEVEKGIPHKMEWVVEKNGTTYINDSKSSDLESTFYALEGLEKNAVWIMGVPGYAHDYEPIQEWLREENIAVFVLGSADNHLKNEIGKHAAIFMEKPTLVEVLSEVQSYVKDLEQSTVLFSPATTTFDLYDNFRERGDHFKWLLRNLKISA